MTSRISSGALRVFGIAIVLFLAVIYLKLGYFILFLLPLGALGAVLLTRKQRAGYPPVRSSVVVIVAYCAAVALVWSAAIQNREETRALKWEVLEAHGQAQPEVRLYLGGSHYVYSFSDDLGRYLRSRPDETVPVVLPVTFILGCFQSVGFPRIEGWGEMPLAGYGAGAGPGPWKDHWWCR